MPTKNETLNSMNSIRTRSIALLASEIQDNADVLNTVFKASGMNLRAVVKMYDNQIVVDFIQPEKKSTSTLSKKLRAEWVNYQLHAFGKSEWRVSEVNPDARFVRLSKREGDRYNSTIIFSTAYCSPDDKFDADVGVAVAYARAMDEQIPDYI